MRTLLGLLCKVRGGFFKMSRSSSTRRSSALSRWISSFEAARSSASALAGTTILVAFASIFRRTSCQVIMPFRLPMAGLRPLLAARFFQARRPLLCFFLPRVLPTGHSILSGTGSADPKRAEVTKGDSDCLG